MGTIEFELNIICRVSASIDYSKCINEIDYMECF